MSAVSASPGMTRIRPNTISDDSTSTGTAMKSRRRTYLYMGVAPGGGLLVQPAPDEGRRAVPVRAPQSGRRGVAHVRLVHQEAVVVRHPQPEHLVELPIDDLLGDDPLLGAIGRPAQLGGQLVDDRIVDPEEVLGRL